MLNAKYVLQDDTRLMWNEMTRLPDTDFMYKALPARTKQQAPRLPAHSSLVHRASLEVTSDGQPVSLCTVCWQKTVIMQYGLWVLRVCTYVYMSLHTHVLLGQFECVFMRDR